MIAHTSNTPLILVLGRLKEEDCEFKASQGYMSPKENEHKMWESILPRHISQRKILLFPADYFKPQEYGVF